MPHRLSSRLVLAGALACLPLLASAELGGRLGRQEILAEAVRRHQREMLLAADEILQDGVERFLEVLVFPAEADGAVPDHRTHKLIDGYKRSSPGNELNPAPLFRLRGGGVPGDYVGLTAARLAVLPGTTHMTAPTRTAWLRSMIEEFLDTPEEAARLPLVPLLVRRPLAD